MDVGIGAGGGERARFDRLDLRVALRGDGVEAVACLHARVRLVVERGRHAGELEEEEVALPRHRTVSRRGGCAVSAMEGGVGIELRTC